VRSLVRGRRYLSYLKLLREEKWSLPGKGRGKGSLLLHKWEKRPALGKGEDSLPRLPSKVGSTVGKEDRGRRGISHLRRRSLTPKGDFLSMKWVFREKEEKGERALALRNRVGKKKGRGGGMLHLIEPSRGSGKKKGRGKEKRTTSNYSHLP